MPKVLTGEVVSMKMQGTAVVRVTSFWRHPIYKKRLKRDRKFKVSVSEALRDQIKEGSIVKIIQTRPISKEKHFKATEVLK